MPSKITSKLIAFLGQGLLAVLPITITFLLLRMIFRFVEGNVAEVIALLPMTVQKGRFEYIAAELLAVGIIILGLILLGAIVRTVFGRVILRQLDTMFEHIPVASAVYKATRQFVDMIGGSGKKSALTTPVFVEYPCPDIWTIAFNTGHFVNVPFGKPGELHYSVFIPTTPNPTSGFLMIVPEHKVRPCDLSAEEAMKLVLTGGVIKSETHTTSFPSIVTHADKDSAT